MSGPTPGSAEWLRYITASKVAAIVGTSPYESRFSLWHRMVGNLPPQEQTDDMARGHYLEDAICRWFADQHPEFVVSGPRWVQHPEHAWAGATLDGLAGDDPLEVKTDRHSWEWRDGVPAGYRDQCQWQAFILGAPRVHVAALVDMEFIERVVERDDDRIAHLLAETRAFRESLATGQAPDLDMSIHTYQAVRELHPDIDPEAVDLSTRAALDFIVAKRELTAAESRWNLARSEMADLMGSAQRATCDGQTVAVRKARNGGTPWVEAPRHLPEIGSAA